MEDDINILRLLLDVCNEAGIPYQIKIDDKPEKKIMKKVYSLIIEFDENETKMDEYFAEIINLKQFYKGIKQVEIGPFESSKPGEKLKNY